MEKLIYALWRNDTEGRDDFNARLLTSLPAALLQHGAQRICLNIQDQHVRRGETLRQTWQNPQPEALVQFWLPSAYHIFRQQIDPLIGQHCDRFAAWCVAESEIISPPQNPDHTSGQRCEGWSQIALIARLDAMPHDIWIAEWQDRHTKVAIETQSNFAYWQNAVTRALTNAAPLYAAIVEECFPTDALTDPMLFFDAANDPQKFKTNLDRMMQSCSRFIAPGMIDVIPTSRYIFGDL